MMPRGTSKYRVIGVLIALAFIGVPILTHLAGTVRSPWGVTPETWQSLQFSELEIALRIYAVEVGELPATDATSSWFEKIIAHDSFLIRDSFDAGLVTPSLEIKDVHGWDVVFEPLPDLSADEFTIRSVGPNGVDENGGGDDWVMGAEPADGTWHKSMWPRGRQLTLVTAVACALAALAIGIFSHRWLRAIGVAFIGYSSAMLIYVGPRHFDYGGPLVGYEGRLGPNAPEGEPIMWILEVTWFLLMIGVLLIWRDQRERLIALYDRYARWLHGDPTDTRLICPECRYDCTRSSHDRCPECGHEHIPQLP